jgi:hypothetical protein
MTMRPRTVVLVGIALAVVGLILFLDALDVQIGPR